MGLLKYFNHCLCENWEQANFCSLKAAVVVMQLFLPLLYAMSEEPDEISLGVLKSVLGRSPPTMDLWMYLKLSKQLFLILLIFILFFREAWRGSKWKPLVQIKKGEFWRLSSFALGYYSISFYYLLVHHQVLQLKRLLCLQGWTLWKGTSGTVTG